MDRAGAILITVGLFLVLIITSLGSIPAVGRALGINNRCPEEQKDENGRCPYERTSYRSSYGSSRSVLGGGPGELGK